MHDSRELDVLNSSLLKEIKNKNIHSMLDCLRRGADVNNVFPSIDQFAEETETTAIWEALEINNKIYSYFIIYKLLLIPGVELNDTLKRNGKTPLQYVVSDEFLGGVVCAETLDILLLFVVTLYFCDGKKLIGLGDEVKGALLERLKLPINTCFIRLKYCLHNPIPKLQSIAINQISSCYTAEVVEKLEYPKPLKENIQCFVCAKKDLEKQMILVYTSNNDFVIEVDTAVACKDRVTPKILLLQVREVELVCDGIRRVLVPTLISDIEVSCVTQQQR